MDLFATQENTRCPIVCSLQHPRQESWGGRVSFDRELSSAVHVPTNSIDTTGCQEDSPGPSTSNPNCPRLAKTGVVHRSDPALHVPTSPSTSQDRPPVTGARAVFAFQPPNPPPSCLKIARNNLSSFSRPPKVWMLFCLPEDSPPSRFIQIDGKHLLNGV